MQNFIRGHVTDKPKRRNFKDRAVLNVSKKDDEIELRLGMTENRILFTIPQKQKLIKILNSL